MGRRYRPCGASYRREVNPLVTPRDPGVAGGSWLDSRSADPRLDRRIRRFDPPPRARGSEHASPVSTAQILSSAKRPARGLRAPGPGAASGGATGEIQPPAAMSSIESAAICTEYGQARAVVAACPRVPARKRLGAPGSTKRSASPRPGQ
jgi:hypothetical protein